MLSPKMKKTLSVLFGLFVVALLGIVAWSMNRTRAAENEIAELKARSDQAQMIQVGFVVKPPAGTPENQPLYLSGNAPALGNWEPTQFKQLTKQQDGSYAGTFELQRGREYAFKVTRGTWGTVERGEKGEDVPNHTFTAADNAPVQVSVGTWVDEGKSQPGRNTLTGAVVLHTKFPSKALGIERDVVVYLPPKYDENEDQRYPVLYMQDGQNLFNSATAFKEGYEWQLDETAQRLMSSGQVKPAIIVGPYNAGEFRSIEFTPPGLADDVSKAKGDQYAKFLVEELKPFIDSRYRTLTDRNNTGIGGGAMGGLIALYTAKSKPETFGFVAVCSPWLRGPDGKHKLDLSGDWMKQDRFYVDMGTKGGGAGYPPFTDHTNASDPQTVQNALADAKELVAAFDSAGLQKGKNYFYEEVAGEYNEPAWEARMEPMLMFLFKGGAPTTQPTANRE